MRFVNSRRLLNSAGATITDLALTNGVAVNSEAIKVEKNTGQVCLLIKEDKAGGAGDVDIYAEYSDTGNTNTWQRAYVSDLAGTISQEGNIVTTLRDATRRIYFQARLARYMRFVFDPDADSQITADIIFQEDE